MKNVYMVVTRRKDIDGKARYYSETDQVAVSTENLMFTFRDRDICTAKIMPSRREARKETLRNNRQFKEQGNYLEMKYW